MNKFYFTAESFGPFASEERVYKAIRNLDEPSIVFGASKDIFQGIYVSELTDIEKHEYLEAREAAYDSVMYEMNKIAHFGI